MVCMVSTMKQIMDLIFYLTRSAPAADSVFLDSTLVPNYFYL
jgi:hypothetical protein